MFSVVLTIETDYFVCLLGRVPKIKEQYFIIEMRARFYLLKESLTASSLYYLWSVFISTCFSLLGSFIMQQWCLSCCSPSPDKPQKLLHNIPSHSKNLKLPNYFSSTIFTRVITHLNTQTCKYSSLVKVPTVERFCVVCHVCDILVWSTHN